MSRPTDFYDHPGAPAANSLVPSVNVIVVNGEGSILLIRRTDNGNWAVPGEAIDLGESVARAAVRETLEESGSSATSRASSASTQTQARNPLHGQRRGAAGVLDRADGTRPEPTANAGQRVE